MTKPVPPRPIKNLLDVADWLDAMAATEAHAGNDERAAAHRDAAKLARARNDQEITHPEAGFVCKNCHHFNGRVDGG